MAEILHGKGTGDQLNASVDKTQVYGLKGNDTLITDNKSDVLLVGGSGNDSIVMMGGSGTLNGGKGSDVFEFNCSAQEKISAVIEDFEPSSDKIVVNFDGETAPQITKEISGSDVVLKDEAGLFNVTLKGVRENDYFDDEASDEVWEVLKLTNAAREKNNLSALTLSEGLTVGASIRAEEITELDEQGRFNEYQHTRPNGESYKTVLVGGDLSLERKYHSYGENLQAGATSPKDVMNALMNSRDHRANILDEKKLGFSKLGVGYNYYDTSKLDAKRHYWTQEFADSLNTAETVSTDELSNAKITVNAVSKSVTLTEGDDTRKNTINGATISALGGNDSVSNTGSKVSVSGGADNDTITNSGSFVTINAGLGNDKISLGASAQNNLIQYSAGDGSDTISGFNANSTLKISDSEYTPVTVGNDVVIRVGNDSITLQGAAKLSNIESHIDGTRSKLYIGTEKSDAINAPDGATVQALGGNDQINLNGKGQTILYSAGDGSDIISGFNANSTLKISGNEYLPVTIGNDVVIGVGNDSITLQGAAKLSTLNIEGTRSKLYIGTKKSDTINAPDGATVQALGGNDQINLSGKGHTILYSAGDGKDTINGFDETSTLKIGDGTGTYSTQTKNNDIIVTVSEGKITLTGAAKLSTLNIEGTWIPLYIGTNDPETINVPVDNATVQALHGNDQINLSGKGHTILYSEGDGSDTINGFDETSTLKIGDGTGTYSTQTKGNDIIVRVGRSSILLKDTANLQTVNIVGTEKKKDNPDTQSGGEDTTPADSKLITLTEGDDTYTNTVGGVTIEALGGDDTIHNYASNVIIEGGYGNDYIHNWSDDVTINGGTGSDSIYNYEGSSSTIDGGDGGDRIYSWSSQVYISGGEANDSLDNNGGDSVTVDGGKGNDYIANDGLNVSINAGAGNDDVINNGYYSDNDTIEGGAGNDTISLSSYAENNLIVYKAGDGDDFIEGFDGDDTLKIFGSYSSATVGSDVIIDVFSSLSEEALGTITLSNAATLTTLNIENNNNFIALTEGDDNYSNGSSNVTIAALGGDDTIDNWNSDNSEINLGAGNDSVVSHGKRTLIDGGDNNDTLHCWIIDDGMSGDSSSYMTLRGGEGNDLIDNHGHHALIEGGEGSDTLQNYIGDDGGIHEEYEAHYSTLRGGAGNDSIANEGSNVTIEGGYGNDYIANEGSNVTINGGAGNDTIHNYGSNASINGGDDNDSIHNYWSDDVTIEGGAGDDSISNSGFNVTINGGAGDDHISHYGGFNVTINGGAGDDTIYNGSDDVTITGGAGDDTIYNYGGANVTINGGAGDDHINYNDGSNVTINGGAGDDTISLLGGATGNVIQYKVGDGSDTVHGFNEDDTISIAGGAYTRSTVGNDVVLEVDDDLITLIDAAGLSVINIIGTENIASNLIKLTEFDDTYSTTVDGATVQALGGDDFISNSYANVSINGGNGDDNIFNEVNGNTATGSRDTINTGAGDDTVSNDSAFTSISTGAGEDSILNYGANVTIDTGDNDDIILNVSNNFDHGWNVSINAGAGKDSVTNYAASVTIDGGDGRDTIDNSGNFSELYGLDDNDSITNSGVSVTIDGGAGKDTIHNRGISDTIIGGKDDDLISLSSASKNNFIQYTPGDGNDVVWGLTPDDTVNISADVSLLSSLGSGNDMIIYVKNGNVENTITLKNARNKPPHVTYGESGTSAGGGGKEGGISGRGGNDKGNSEGGGSKNEGKGSDASSGKSASGRGREGSKGGSGEIFARLKNSQTKGETLSKEETVSEKPADDSYIYNGGNQVIGDYQANKKIIFKAAYTSAVFDEAGNFLAGSNTGALAVQNSANKFIDVRDGNGNAFLKAYSATNSGVIDGRGLAGFEMVNGSSGADAIFAGDGGSQLWGGSGDATDTLVGGNGADIFVGGQTQGGDIFQNASAQDEIRLNDATLNDIAATEEDNGTIAVVFNNGNVIYAQSSEPLSAKFNLADGSAYRFNHAEKTWQAEQHAYNGGNQVITNYAGEKILFNAEYTGALFDEANNFRANSTTGELTITDAANKIIDIRDGAGNAFVKAYAATNPGTIDGRGLAGFEIINGSDGSDEIFAGDGGSQLWGGAGSAADVLNGGDGADIFLVGKNEGNDHIGNAFADDNINLHDVNLSDILFTATDGNLIGVAFNTGNVITAQSTEPLSAKFNLADGSAYRFNHETKSWQNA